MSLYSTQTYLFYVRNFSVAMPQICFNFIFCRVFFSFFFIASVMLSCEITVLCFCVQINEVMLSGHFDFHHTNATLAMKRKQDLTEFIRLNNVFIALFSLSRLFAFFLFFFSFSSSFLCIHFFYFFLFFRVSSTESVF